MTSNVLYFRVARPTPLVCVWQATGQPKASSNPQMDDRRNASLSSRLKAGWRLCA